MHRFEQRTNLILIVSSLILAIGVGILIPLAMGDQPDLFGGDARTPTIFASPTTASLPTERPVKATARPAAMTAEPRPAHTAAATDRPTESVPSPSALPSVTPSPAPGATLNPMPSAAPTAPAVVPTSPTPTLAPSPVPTIERSPSPVPTQSTTPPRPAATTAAIPGATAPAQEITLLPPTLEAPAADTETDAPITFAWQAAQPLPAGAAYEVVAWETGQPPSSARGLAAPTTDTSLPIDLAVPYSLGVFKTAELSWTVLIVQTSPYQRLTLPDGSPTRTLRYTPAPNP
jgi:hypothetical protein